MTNKFLDAMLFRHACKEFDATKKISKEDFTKILEYGQKSPSSFGFEPWKFVIVQNKDLREKLKEFSWGAQGQLPTASHFVLILARKFKTMDVQSEYLNNLLQNIKQMPDDIESLIKKYYEDFYKTNFGSPIDDEKFSAWSAKQGYIALANMMSGAAYLGIDSCPIEGFEKPKVQDFLATDLKINTNEFEIAVMAAFGYRKNEPRLSPRQKLEDITAWYE